jgi:putative flippase GtrA
VISERHSRVLRFGVVGATVAVVYIVLYLMLLSFGVAQIQANLVAFLLAIVLQYLGQTLWTFRRPLAVPDQLGRFLFTISLGLVVSGLITGTLGPALGWANWVSAVIVTVVLPVQNYLFFRNWVFSDKKNPMEKP